MSQQTFPIYPQSKEDAGRAYWATFFNMASLFPDNPTKRDRSNVENFIKTGVKGFVCRDCVQHATEYIKANPIVTDTKESLMKWLCGLKNNANRHENKPEVDCNEFLSKSVRSTVKSCETCDTTTPTKEAEQPPQPVYNPFERFSYTKATNNFLDKYPLIKKAMGLYDSTGFQPTPPRVTPPNVHLPTVPHPGLINTVAQNAQGLPPSQQFPPVTNPMAELSQRYPTLSGIDLTLDKPPEQEQLDGVLKSLDTIYTIPAQAVGIPPAMMNLAYSPEMLSNGVSLITQMYLTNAGSMITTLSSSILLIIISIFAKSHIASYDRLFIQNVAGSLLFHTVNFLNPRAKKELIPDLKKLMQGALKGDMKKVKESLLYKNKEEEKENTADKHAQHLLNLIKSKKGIIDMKALATNHSPGTTLKDLRSGGSHGFGSTGGTLTREEYDAMMDDGGPMLGDETNYDSIIDAESEYGYMLDNPGI